MWKLRPNEYILGILTVVVRCGVNSTIIENTRVVNKTFDRLGLRKMTGHFRAAVRRKTIAGGKRPTAVRSIYTNGIYAYDVPVEFNEFRRAFGRRTIPK